MNRKLKAIGLVIASMMVMALSASAASAGDFHSEATHTIIKGTQSGEDKFTVNAGTVTCKKAEYEGTQGTATATEQTLIPEYGECTAFGFVSTPVVVSNCEYVFTPTDSTHPIHINNVGTKTCTIVVQAFNCWVTVKAQTPTTAKVTYVNEGAGNTRDIKSSVEVTVEYTQESKSFPGCSNGTFTNGVYKGAATVKGFGTSGEQVGIWEA